VQRFSKSMRREALTAVLTGFQVVRNVIVSTDKILLTCHRSVITLSAEALIFLETLVTIFLLIRSNIPEYVNFCFAVLNKNSQDNGG
jgi:hypothetical protein